MPASPFASAESVHHSLRRLDRLLEREIVRLRVSGRLHDHPARGLFLEEAHVRALLQERAPDDCRELERLDEESVALRRLERGGALARLASLFDLTPLEADMLLVAIAPELDARYETAYAYAQNDVTKRRPTVDLALRLACGTERQRLEARAALHPGATLQRDGLLALSDGPWAARTIATDARLAAFLLGGDQLDERLLPFTSEVRSARPVNDLPFDRSLVARCERAAARCLAHGGVVVLTARRGAGKRSLAASCCCAAGRPVLVADLHTSPPVGLLGWLRREARLRHAGVYVSLPDATPLEAVRRAFDGSGVAVFAGRRRAGEDDHLADFRFDLPAPPAPARLRLWREALGGEAPQNLEDVSAKFVLLPAEIERAAQFARRQSSLRPGDHPCAGDDLHAAARAQAGSGLARLAQRVEPVYDWDDLVLPARAVRQLREICARVRHRERVLVAWDFDRKRNARGLTILFAGPSGTGKTMSASVVARELGFDLYRIDLATVVSKYIGETEKNLARIFDEAETSNAILFFDEADALFGKRSEVKDAHDRYANLEVAYLLQRMETYPGVAILATNLRANLDEAFARRMAHCVEFPSPDASLRERLWRLMLPEKAPLAASVDFNALASQFEVSGGNIRNITLAAAFLAADEGVAIDMEHLVRATARELEKIGRLPSRAEFRGYYDLVRERA